MDGHFQSCLHFDDLKLKMYIFEMSIVCLCLYLMISYIAFLKYSILTATLWTLQCLDQHLYQLEIKFILITSFSLDFDHFDF